uniref:NADH-ubiquinone oxidoreductase chain 2 n=1 Tax=Caenis pycnacantha TaxID=675576 RepID=X1W3C4_9INSE|nr:NADH dehydrogenase subunit 2 [Caenis pycnacantha]
MSPSSLLFLLTLIMGTLITISSTSWFGVWMGLEMNLLSFVPLMAQSNKFSTEAALKYFLTQAFASVVLLMGVVMTYLDSPLANSGENLPTLAILLAALVKMGAAPVHFWFPEVSGGLQWNSNMILMTWQKIAPFIVLMYLEMPPTILILAASFSALAGALGGFNQTSMRKILAFSSINHMAWMIVSVTASQALWMTYFMTYSVMTLVMMVYFNFNNINTLPQMTLSSLKSPLESFLVSANMLSMGGLPPFLGFFPKWMVMEFMISQGLFILALFMIFMTLIVLYFYLRLTYPSFMFFSHSPKFMPTKTQPSPIFLLWASVSGLIVAPLMI